MYRHNVIPSYNPTRPSDRAYAHYEQQRNLRQQLDDEFFLISQERQQLQQQQFSPSDEGELSRSLYNTSPVDLSYANNNNNNNNNSSLFSDAPSLQQQQQPPTPRAFLLVGEATASVQRERARIQAEREQLQIERERLAIEMERTEVQRQRRLCEASIAQTMEEQRQRAAQLDAFSVPQQHQHQPLVSAGQQPFEMVHQQESQQPQRRSTVRVHGNDPSHEHTLAPQWPLITGPQQQHQPHHRDSNGLRHFREMMQPAQTIGIATMKMFDVVDRTRVQHRADGDGEAARVAAKMSSLAAERRRIDEEYRQLRAMRGL